MTSSNSSKNRSYFGSPFRDRQSKISTEVVKNLRRLWPKYDIQLDQLITGHDSIQELIHLSFKDAGFLQKFKEIGRERAKDGLSSLKELIYQTVRNNEILNQIKYDEIDSQMQLTQSELVEIIMEFLGDRPLKQSLNSTLKANKLRREIDQYNSSNQTIKSSSLFPRNNNSASTRYVKKVIQGVSVGERLHDHAMLLKSSKTKANIEKKQSEIEEAYYLSQAPITRHNGEEMESPRRTIEEFLMDQQQFEFDKSKKLQKMIINEELKDEIYDFQPYVSEKSKNLLKKLDHDPKQVSKQKRQLKEKQILEERKSLLKPAPKISNFAKLQKRDLNTILEDTARRQFELHEYEKNQAKKLDQSKPAPLISANSDRVLFERFELDFFEACEKFELFKESDMKIHPMNIHEAGIEITCAMMSKLFLECGFVKPNDGNNEQMQLAQIWRLVRGDAYGREKVPLQRVKAIQCAIQNFHIDWIIDALELQGTSDNDRDQTNGSAQVNQGRIESETGFLIFTPKEIQKISQKYCSLYKNRMQKLQNDRKEHHLRQSISKQIYGEVASYKPHITPRNERLASQKLARNPHLSQMPIEKRLVIQDMERKMRLERQKEEHDQSILSELKDKPFVRDSSLQLSERKSVTLRARKDSIDSKDFHSNLSKWDHLHLESRKLQLREDKDFDMDELQKNAHIYTFQPNKQKRQFSRTKTDSIRNNASSVSSSERIYSSQQALKKPSLKPSLNQGRKSQHSNQGVDKKTNELIKEKLGNQPRQKQAIKTFLISVNIGGKRKEMQAQFGQDPNEIAKKFLKLHQVDQKLHETLTQLIVLQVKGL